jgi:ubiquinone/menaquinone biosynthesis C-methylase UbiE
MIGVARASMAAGVLGALAGSPAAVPALSERPRVEGPAPPARDQSGQTGRLFAPRNLGLLEAPDRDQWQKPDFIMDELQIADGSSVADLGAGGGWFSIRLARRVGPNGVVYAQDIQPLMIEATSRNVLREGLKNVVPVLGTPSDPKLPQDGRLDAVLIVGAFHEMDDPARPEVILTLLNHVAQSLKPQGRLGVVDFLPGAGGPGPDPDERVDPGTVIAAAAAARLKLQKRETIPPFTYLLVFVKDAGVVSAR